MASRPQGRCIGNYVLSKTLGEGTFGKVKLGIHVLTGEKVRRMRVPASPMRRETSSIVWGMDAARASSW
eukprot:6201140-Pleurochrysis_carterae.AAC.4